MRMRSRRQQGFFQRLMSKDPATKASVLLVAAGAVMFLWMLPFSGGGGGSAVFEPTFVLTAHGRKLLNSGKAETMLVIGTRPEAIKMAPLYRELLHRCIGQGGDDCVQPFVCVTGQHRDLLKQFLQELDMPTDVLLKTFQRGQSLGQLSAHLITGSSKMFEEISPRIVLVQGDTTSALEVAYSAFLKHIPVGHVEAGLRTYNLQSPFPEEMNRQLIAGIATFHFAPTKASADALAQEGVNPAFIFQTGNTAIDGILQLTSSSESLATAKENLRFLKLQQLIDRVVTTPYVGDSKAPRLILLTTHRRENHNGGHKRIFQAAMKLCNLFENLHFVLPLHPNPLVQKAAKILRTKDSCVMVVDPVGYAELALLQKMSVIVMTDSGGIQEEATAMRKPVLVLRQNSERMEGVHAGVAKLVGSADAEKIVREATALLRNENDIHTEMSQPKFPYGDGTAAVKIADQLAAAKRKGTMSYMKGRVFSKQDRVADTESVVWGGVKNARTGFVGT